jgi:flagellar FliL protein
MMNSRGDRIDAARRRLADHLHLRSRTVVLAVLALALIVAAALVAFVLTREATPIVEIEFGGPLVYYDFPDVIADLKGDDGRARYVKLGIVVEVPDDLRPRLDASRAAIIDALHAFLREQRAADLVGEAGAERVRAALTSIINEALAPGEVKAVLFRQFILS